MCCCLVHRKIHAWQQKKHGWSKASELVPCSLLPYWNPNKAIFHDGITLRLKLNGWSKIRDPVLAKFKHVTVIVTYMLLCCDWITYVPALWNFQKAVFEPYSYGKKYTTFSFPIQGALASNICLRDVPTWSCIQLYTKRSGSLTL